VLLGEWGGLWEAAEWPQGVMRPSTKVWQQAFAAYLNTNGIGHFYWTLNDNSFRTGSLFNDWTGASELKLAMLAASPATYMPVLESSWAEHWSSLLEAPPPSPPAVAPPFLFG